MNTAIERRLCIDLFCGMGGWSVGFHREGFRCVGIDRVDVGYPYEMILKDIRDYHPELWWSRSLRCARCGADVTGFCATVGYFCREHFA